MEDVNRRSALVLGLAMASAVVLGRQGVAEAAVGEETELAKGVKQKILGEGPAMIPGYKTVQLRDISWEPGASLAVNTMKNPMVCHITEGELLAHARRQAIHGEKELRLDLQYRDY